MEPFRVFVDRLVYYSKFKKFESAEKYALWNILNSYVKIGGMTQTMQNGIRIYTKSVFEALNDGDLSKIKFADVINE
jgi:hypothetical protein